MRRLAAADEAQISAAISAARAAGRSVLAEFAGGRLVRARAFVRPDDMLAELLRARASGLVVKGLPATGRRFS